jgi:hypothetical protein
MVMVMVVMVMMIVIVMVIVMGVKDGKHGVQELPWFGAGRKRGRRRAACGVVTDTVTLSITP